MRSRPSVGRGVHPPQSAVGRGKDLVARSIAGVLLPLVLFAAPAAHAQDHAPDIGRRISSEAAVDDGYACPPVPDALVRHRATSELPPPPPTAADLAAYHAYVALLQANDWGFLCRYRDENRLLANEPHPRVVLIGDSITENWKQRDAGLFVDGIVDRGIGGQTSPQMLLRFAQDVIALHPGVVQIMAGINDIAENTGPMSDIQYQENIRGMVTLARANGIKVILASILPARAFPWKPALRPAQRIMRWNAWLRRYADAEGLVFVDYYAVMVDVQGGLRPDYDSDGVHPSHAGYQRMDPLFEQALARAERR